MDKKINRKLLVLGGLIVLALILSSLAPHLLGDSLPKVNLGQALQGPSSSEWFGTDALGRSVFARAVSGGAETVLPALMILMLIAAVGSFIGVTSAFIGGKFDQLILLVITAFQSFPSIILVIAIVSILGIGLQQTLIAICLTAWTKYAYLMRSMNLSTIIMEIAGLSFVGLGAQAPSPEWGAMINDGRIYIQEAPWIVVFPCILLILTILLFTKFGDALNSKYNRMS